MRELLSELDRLEVKIWVEGDRLRVRAPKDALSSRLRTALAEQKENLLTLLRQREQEEPIVRIEPDPANRHVAFPLTDMQQAYWVGRSSGLDLDFSIHGYIETEGTELDPDRLEAALRRLVRRHDMLRAVVTEEGLQRILPEMPPVTLREVDLRGKDPDFVARELARLREELSYQVLPLDRCPPFDFRVTRLDGGRLRLHLSLDCIFIDHWSFQTLFRELIELYRSPEATLDPATLDLSFRDYVLAHRNLETTAAFERSLAYWRERIPHLPGPPQLPLARQPEEIEKPRIVRYRHDLGASIWQQLKAQGSRRGLTPPAVLLAAFSEVLAAWSSNSHFCLNVPLFNRQSLHPQVNQILGNFSSFVPVEFNRRDGNSLEARARAFHLRRLEESEHSRVSGVRILREMFALRGELSSGSLPIVFTSLPAGLEGRTATYGDAFDGELGEVIYAIGQTPQVWIDHQAVYEGSSLYYNWDVVEGLFPDGMVAAMFDAYTGLLERLAAGDEAWQDASLCLVPEQQEVRHRSILASHVEEFEPAHQAVLRQMQASPEGLAVVSSGQRLSYGELESRVASLSQQLLGFGIGSGDRVGLVMEKGWEQVVGVLATLVVGAAYQPIDPSLPQERQFFLLDHGQVQFALTQPHLRSRLPWPEGVRPIVVIGPKSAGNESADLRDGETSPSAVSFSSTIHPGDLAYVLYTSGSTGEPKGVMVTHQGLQQALQHTLRTFAISPQDRVLGVTALHHDMSSFDLLGVLAAGGVLVLPDPVGTRDPEHWLELIEREQVTLWNSVPAMMEMLLEHLSVPRLRGAGSVTSVQSPLPAPKKDERGHGGSFEHRGSLPLRLIFLGGDWIPVDLPQRLQAAGSLGRVVSVGGPTETTLWNITHSVEAVQPQWKSIPYGRPIAGTEYFILDDDLNQRPDWVPGELCCSGVGLARGYWRDPEKTASRFVPHPQTGARLYRTGDLGRWLPDGAIEFLGRRDRQIKIRGQRIEPGEVEAALCRHPAVRKAVVKAVKRGKDPLLAAWVQPPEDLATALGLPGVEVDPVKRVEFKLASHGSRARTVEGESIALFPAGQQPDSRGAWFERQSYRRYAQRAIELSSFSQFLSSLAARVDDLSLPKYRYPSAGGLYPVQTYVLIKPGAVAGLSAGIWYLDPTRGELLLVDPWRRSPSGVFPLNVRGIWTKAGFAILLVGKLRAIEPIYGEASEGFCLLEAGYMGQLLMTEAPGHGLGLCPVGHFQLDPLRAALDLEPGDLGVHALLGGPIEEEQKSQWLGEPPMGDFQALLQEELQEFLSEQLPAALIPSRFVVLQQMPLSRNGKVDVGALKLPDSAPRQTAARDRPRNELEEQVAAIWQQVLEVDEVSVNDNFFELGGHSVLLVRVRGLLQELLGRQVAITDLFRYSTIAQLAAHWGKGTQDGEFAPPARENQVSRSQRRREAGRLRLRRQDRREGPPHEDSVSD